MAIDLTTLFTQVGKLAKTLKDYHAFQATTLPTDVNAAIAALGTLYDVAAPLPGALATAQQAPGIASTLQSVARNLVLTTVNADTPLASRTDLNLALTELIRQMAATGASVAACTVSATAAADAGNDGTGLAVTTVLRGDGLAQQNLFAEVGIVTCTGDAQGGTATAGSEPWTFRGDFAPANPLGYDWPGFSGGSVGLTTIDSHAGTNGQNVLVNSGFETFTTANQADNWTYLVGATGTNFLAESTTVQRGSKALKLLGDGATLHSLAQTFNDATNGSPVAIRPNRTLAYAFWTRLPVGGTTLTGTNLRVDLVDGTNTAVTDDQGVTEAISHPQSGVGTAAWDYFVGSFRTPAVLPDTLKLRLTITGTAIGTGAGLVIDSLGFGEMTFLYPGGPALALFAGVVPWKLNDKFSLTTANNQAGASYGATFQRVFDRFFGMRSLGLLLPYSGSPTISDSLIG